MNFKYIIAGLLVFVASTNAYADEKKNEISAFLYANKTTTPSGQDPIVTMYGSYGRYFGRFALTVSGIVTKAGGSNMVFGGVGGKYYFKAGQKGDFVPFLTAEIQLNVGSSGSTDLYGYNIAGGGGVSVFITETASLDGRLVYQTGSTTATTYGGLGGYTDTTYSTASALFTLGLTQRF